MYDSDFKLYLSDNLDIDYEIIEKIPTTGINEFFNIAKVLIQIHKVDKAILGKIWGSYLGFAYVDPNTSIVNQEYIKKAGVNFILENKVLPLYKFGRALTVSTSNPKNPFLQDKIEKKLDEIVSLVFCFPFDIEIYLRNNNLI